MISQTPMKRSRFSQLVLEMAVQQKLSNPAFERITLDAPGYTLVSRVVLDWWPREQLPRLIERHTESFRETRVERRRDFAPEITEGMVRTVELMWQSVHSYKMTASPEDIWTLAILHDFRKRSPGSWDGESQTLRLQVLEGIESDLGDIKFWDMKARALPQLTWPNGKFLESSSPKSEDELASLIVALRRAIESEWAMVEIFHSRQMSEAKLES